MTTIAPSLSQPSAYRDRQSNLSDEEFLEILSQTCTLYVGNLSFYTTEEQIYEVFSKVGEIRRIVMGLDRNKKTPCGFCFVEYYTQASARDALLFVNGTKLDERIIRTDLDPGFVEGRQFGRGKSGGQVRDEHRVEYDPGRGGWGHKKSEMMRSELYADFDVAPSFAGAFTGSAVPAGAGSFARDRKRRASDYGTGGKRFRDGDQSQDEAME